MKAGQIDLTEVQRLLDEGLNQKQIAQKLSVTPAGICKALKRLKGLQLPASMGELTQKQQNYVLRVASGESRTSAAFHSFDVTDRMTAKSMACELSQNPKIQACMADLLEQKGGGRSHRADLLVHHMDAVGNPAQSLKALEIVGKLAGDDAPQPPAANTYTEVDLSVLAQRPISDISDQELARCDMDTDTIDRHLAELRSKLLILEAKQASCDAVVCDPAEANAPEAPEVPEAIAEVIPINQKKTSIHHYD